MNAEQVLKLLPDGLDAEVRRVEKTYIVKLQSWWKEAQCGCQSKVFFPNPTCAKHIEAGSDFLGSFLSGKLLCLIIICFTRAAAIASRPGI
jgi:hypothetical protein